MDSLQRDNPSVNSVTWSAAYVYASLPYIEREKLEIIPTIARWIASSFPGTRSSLLVLQCLMRKCMLQFRQSLSIRHIPCWLCSPPVRQCFSVENVCSSIGRESPYVFIFHKSSSLWQNPFIFSTEINHSRWELLEPSSPRQHLSTRKKRKGEKSRI